MDNIVSAIDLKRRGMAAIEDGLKRGPLRIIKRNRPAAVVLSVAEYEQLQQLRQPTMPGMTALEWLLANPLHGTLSKREIDRRLRDERAW